MLACIRGHSNSLLVQNFSVLVFFSHIYIYPSFPPSIMYHSANRILLTRLAKSTNFVEDAKGNSTIKMNQEKPIWSNA